MEAVSKGDIMSAFSNYGRPQPIHSVDIEGFTQDVWEPGLAKNIPDGLGVPGRYYCYTLTVFMMTDEFCRSHILLKFHI